MEKEKTEKKITKLCSEYSRRVMSKKAEITMLLIDFAREYNEIWNNASSADKANNSQQNKKGEEVPLQNSLETRSKAGEDKKTVMPVDADNHSADTLTGSKQEANNE